MGTNELKMLDCRCGFKFPAQITPNYRSNGGWFLRTSCPNCDEAQLLKEGKHIVQEQSTGELMEVTVKHVTHPIEEGWVKQAVDIGGNKMKYSKFYNEAADLVEKGWTRATMARDKSGLSCHPLDKCATSWCLSGAFGCVASYNVLSLAFCEDLKDYLKLDVPLSRWNDARSRTQKEVVKFLRDAAKRADEEGMILG